VAKAIASFERTVVSRNSPFDRWVAGDAKALNKDQVAGFAIFIDPKRGNCMACHSGANFTDNGFHNLGLASHGAPEPDMGRYSQRPLEALKGAFKTPTVREVASTAPYFHDGSAATLADVVEHYVKGGVVKSHLSKDVRPLNLSSTESMQLVSFMEALTSPAKPFVLPVLPR
jgi:cytochrome c peroxidase